MVTSPVVTRPATPPPSAPVAATPAPGVTSAAAKQWDAPPAMVLEPDVSYTATIATSDGKLGVQLLPGLAPNAVNNFRFLAGEGFYDHVPIHRMVPGFMAQSGDPTGTGTGGPGYTIPDDPMPGDVRYTRGVLAMANTGEPDSAGSQFFVMLGDTPLPPTYSVFGHVTSGLDVLDRLNARTVVDNGQGEQSKPAEPIWVEGVTISEAKAPRPDA